MRSTVPPRLRDEGNGDAGEIRSDVPDRQGRGPALAISGLEILNRWYLTRRISRTCPTAPTTPSGVWSESTVDRTVVAAVYGRN
ncbi:hypothetical protein MTER_24660 [Mycolicibacter terrae]|uniref:Uncharacterized protein n=1 Tax=Mycolicibacter terrae TaxID=1788 RepID=A0AAD1HYT4_9MYCO|nr:hypothetical protein MTER_24660 [Mycolicibacter terrae]